VTRWIYGNLKGPVNMEDLNNHAKAGWQVVQVLNSSDILVKRRVGNYERFKNWVKGFWAWFTKPIGK